MREWKQYTILIISVFIISVFLYRLICFHQYQGKIKNDVSQQVESKEKTDSPEPPKANIENIYEKLNKNILDYPFQNDESSMIQERVSPRYDTKKRGISEILLIGEDNNITDTWDIYGKTSIVFGRDEGSFQVDVNLKNTDYAGTIDGEHAVMNYSSGSWYIEDLDSENGTRIQRGGNGKVYKVSSREPCRVERGDIIYLGLAPIKVR